MSRNTLLALALTGILWGCTTYPQCKTETQQPDGRPPVIVDHYAAKEISPGNSWRVYLRAKQGDGAMKHIVAIVTQRGRGPYATCFIAIKPEESKQFAGFFFLRTPPNPNLTQDQFTMKVRVSDCQGNETEPLEFTLNFELGASQVVPDSWKPVADHKLGALMIDIKSTMPMTGPIMGR
ncbi:MAG: hypothetical protein JSU72_03485 [Deltaproteobacteria bacterium]|nr:MAG: hypothetical protein JSU72_03485 [Deltaproteobacteria bacterium]